MATTVKQATGLSSRRLKAPPTDLGFLRTRPDAQNAGVLVAAQTYVDGRYLEIQTYDYDAPAWRSWGVTMLDRHTGASVTLLGAFQQETTIAALTQIGALENAP